LRASPDAAAEPVLVQFGESALTILRFDETPIDHWPLASLRRLACEDGAVTLSPDHDAPERLRIADADMIAAIETVSRGLTAPPPRRRRKARRWLRRVVWAAAVAALGVGLWRAAPLALDALADASPPAARATLGDAAAERLLGGAICRDRKALAAQRRWARALAGEIGAPVRIVVAAPGALDAVALLPGGRVLLPAEALRDEPGETAAAVSAALDAARRDPPIRAALRGAGLAGVVALLRGAPDGEALTEAAIAALSQATGAAVAPSAGAAEAGMRAAAPSAADYAAIRTGCGAAR
jgi:hypothetical protein